MLVATKKTNALFFTALDILPLLRPNLNGIRYPKKGPPNSLVITGHKIDSDACCTDDCSCRVCHIFNIYGKCQLCKT